MSTARVRCVAVEAGWPAIGIRIPGRAGERPEWDATWREPGGRQVKRRIGKAWTKHGRAEPGFFTTRTAEDWLRRELADLDAAAARGVQLDLTFEQAPRECLRYVE